MPRPTWKPTSDEQRAVLAKLDEVATKVQEDTAELWETIEKARRLHVPAHLLAERCDISGVSRSTIYRRLGENTPDSEQGASTS